MIRTIYIFANFGNFKELPLGGGQSSARRTMDTLRKMGYNVVPIVRHRSVHLGKISHKLEVLSFALIDIFKILSKTITGNRDNAIFFHLTYSGSLLPYEYILAKMMHIMGYRNFMYLQGGRTNRLYYNGSTFYKNLFKKTMDLHEEVMFEGMENLKLVQSISNIKTFYFPNYTEDGFNPETLPIKPKGVINICYVGRIQAVKNVLIGIETYNILCKKYHNIHYTIIGGGRKNDDYEERVIKAINESPHKKNITKLPSSSHAVIKEILKSQHIYLFPSNESVEGHSNALNEAMAWGCVPVISNNNYLPDIVDDPNLVVYDFKPESYAKKIEEIIETMDIEQLSKKMYERVKNNFIQSVVEKNLCENLKQF